MPRQIAAHCTLRSKLGRKAADAPNTLCCTPASSMRTPSLHAACARVHAACEAHVQDSTRTSLETAAYDDNVLVAESDCDEICGFARYYPCSHNTLGFLAVFIFNTYHGPLGDL
eukprot:4716555-Pleurochrysis_carterae.AAC.1